MGRRLAVVLITWNSARYLRRCAEGLAAQMPDEIVVVDNASGDESAALAASLLPPAKVIRNATNRGFAAAANQGIAATTGEWILLINPDVFLDVDYCNRSIAELEARADRFGAATGKLLRGVGDSIEPTNIIDSKGIRMTRSGRHLDIDAGQPDSGASGERTSSSASRCSPAKPSGAHEGVDGGCREVFGVSGAAAIYRRSFLEDVTVGGQVFDEDFFAYREDADLAWRGRLFGWKALYVPSALAWHVRRVTPEARRELPDEINMHSVKNRFLLRLKNEGGFLALRNAPFELARDLVVLLATLTVERSSLPAWGWLWKNRASIRQKREEIQRRRRVSDRDLSHWFT